RSPSSGLLSEPGRALILGGRWTMVDNVVPTLAPQSRAPETPSKTKPSISPLSTDSKKLLDSIAQEDAQEGREGSFQSYFTAFLWFGYAVAIVVAVVLVWSASKELISAIPH